MLIPLSDPIWSRLYGPYGIQDVPTALAELTQVWDAETASKLYWEMLFHQGDVYPVTYAALPWIWHLLGQIEAQQPESLYFLSMVLMCSQRRDSPPALHANFSKDLCGNSDSRRPCAPQPPRYYGLALDQTVHAKSWLPSELHLTKDDMKALGQLEDWLTGTADAIAEACLEAVPNEKSSLAATLCFGFCALRRGNGAINLIALWGDDHDLEFIREVVSLDADDIRVIDLLLQSLNGKNTVIAKFIDEYFGRGQSAELPGQLSLPIV